MWRIGIPRPGAHAAWALGRIGGAQASDTLIAALRLEGDLQVRGQIHLAVAS